MNIRLGWVATAAMLSLAAAGCATMNVSSHVARNADFTQYRTWDWGPADALPTGDPRLDSNPFFKDHFEGAVEKGLGARGLARAETGTRPDLLIHYHANISQRFLVTEPPSDCTNGCEVTVVEYEQGTLVLDIVDERSDRLIWRGWAQDSVRRSIDNQDRLERQINEGVTRMLARLPRGL